MEELINEDRLKEAGLSGSQIVEVKKLIKKLLGSNKFSLLPDVIEKCPKCGVAYPHLTKGGRTGNGNLMLKCGSCKRRFVRSNGHMIFYSHKDEHIWKEMMIDTLIGVTLRASAERLDMNLKTAFYMRHKILQSLENEAAAIKMDGNSQADETYVETNHKGTKIKYHPELENLYVEKKRGISNQQVCIISTVDEENNCFLKATNCGHATIEDAFCLRDHLVPRSEITIDGTAIYNKLIKEMGLSVNVVKQDGTHHEYNLLRINALHSMVKQRYHRYKGIATKYLNRYCNMFIAIWKLLRETGETKIGNLSSMIRGKDSFNTREDLMNFNIFTPDNIEYAL